MKKIICYSAGVTALVLTLCVIFINYAMASSAGYWQTTTNDRLIVSLLLGTLILGASCLVFSLILLNTRKKWIKISFNVTASLTMIAFICVSWAKIGIWITFLGIGSVLILLVSFTIKSD